jgi:hypothetical protein
LFTIFGSAELQPWNEPPKTTNGDVVGNGQQEYQLNELTSTSSVERPEKSKNGIGTSNITAETLNVGRDAEGNEDPGATVTTMLAIDNTATWQTNQGFNMSDEKSENGETSQHDASSKL